MTVLPIKPIGSVRHHVLRHAVEQVSDGVAGPYARPIRREYLVGTAPQQQFERLRKQVLQSLADDLVGVGHYPATEAEVAHRSTLSWTYHSPKTAAASMTTANLKKKTKPLKYSGAMISSRA